MITILCPSRARPEQFKRMIESALATAHKPEDISFLCYLGRDDPHLREYNSEMRQAMLFIGPPWSSVMGSNYLAEQAKKFCRDTKLFMVGADDMIFSTPLWDKALLDAYDGLSSKIHVFSLLDSRDSNGTPHPIMTTEFVAAMGYFLPPLFLHWYADTWIVDVAKANNCFTHLRDYLLIHRKPGDEGHGDETHNRIRLMGWHERDKFVNDTCRHFLEMEKERIGRIVQQQAGTREHID